MANVQAKKHVCEWQDCGKSFSRSDHLQRHQLNHISAGSTCQRCRAHFKRPDLLERHMLRHQQKDEEAGGPGRGVVETRKRAWVDENGNVVSKKPSIGDGRPTEEISTMSSEEMPPQDVAFQAPPSPPRSHGTDPDEPHIPFPDDMHMDHSQQIFEYVPSMPLPEPGTHDMSDFLANSSWGQHQPAIVHQSVNNHLWSEAFAPDTASSFNMPYTTMTNYSWLFDANAAGLGSQVQPIMNGRMPHMTNEAHHTFNQMSNMGPARMPLTSEALQNQRPDRNCEMQPSLPLQSFLAQNDFQLFKSIDELSASQQVQGHPSTVESPESHLSASTSPQALSSSAYAAPSSHTSASHVSVRPRPPATKPRHASTSYPESSSIHSFHPCSSPRNLPRLGTSARERILDVILQARTRTPDGVLVSQNHSLLSQDSLEIWFELFWTKFNAVYPLIHPSTFDSTNADTLLLIAILLLGATYSDKNAHRLAVCIHDILRPQIFQHAEFTSTPSLWVLQTILLVECFGKSRAGQKQHDMSHLFHGLLINLIRRSDCQTATEYGSTDPSDDLQSQWRMAMDVESRKRLAFLCFMWDTQHAVLFSQSLCMSSFELKTTLPCGPSVWEAETAEEWQQARDREPPPKLYLPVLKAYMSPSGPTQSHNLNALSRLLILHGLMSVSWDMKRRDDTSLGCGSLIGTDDWRARIGASYDLWRADFDTYCLNISSSLNRPNYSSNPNIRSEFQNFTTSTLAIYHAAHIILNVEVLDLQIYAGAKHIIGRPVSSTDYERSRRTVRDWAQQKSTSCISSSSSAVWHAAHLLRDGIMNLDDFANSAFHYPWCLYLATLVLWSFHSGSRDDRENHMNGQNSSNRGTGNEDATSMSMGMYTEDDMLWDAKAEMNALVSGMTSGVPQGLWRIAGKYSTKGLITIMARHLSAIRWAVIHEGQKVLLGLTSKTENV